MPTIMGMLSLYSIFKHSISCIIIRIFIFSEVATLSPTTLEDILTTYSNPRYPSPMQRVIVHAKGDVFVGARNSLYHFNSDLVPISIVTTGPHMDNPKCLHPNFPCSENRTVMDNDNKVLAFMQVNSLPVLLNCGTLYQGLCLVHKLNDTNLRMYAKPFNDTVSFVSGRGSTVAFTVNRTNHVFLYSATTYDDRPLQFAPVSVSTRKIFIQNGDMRFAYAHKTDTETSGVDFALKREYKVEYIAGFSTEDHAYFLTTQRVSVESEVMETRIARICLKDNTYLSYTEVPLKCNYGLEVYNLATAAHKGVASPHLKRRLKLEKYNDVLFVSFVRSVPDHGRLVDKTRGSVICSFPLSTLIGSFTNATKDCFKAAPRTSLLKHVTGLDVSCKERDDVQIHDDFCGSAFNHYIAGTESIPGGFRAHLDAHVTSLATIVQKDKSIAVAGTDTGDIIKVDMDKNKKQVLFTKNIATDEVDKTVQSSNAFDPRHENIYFLVGSKVVKFPIGSCSVYTDCGSCLSTTDPLNCGWCGDKCSHFDECEVPDTFTKNSCAPVIYSIQPLQGPTEGGTLITVTGDNFGASHVGETQSEISINVAGVPCEIFSWKKEEVKCKTKAIKDKFLNGSLEISVSDLSWDAGEFDMKGTAKSEEMYTYLTPILFGIYPGKGPFSGGTNITLEGFNLDIGYERTIKVAGIPCRSFQTYSNSAWCITDRIAKESSHEREDFPKCRPVELYIDDAVIETEIQVPVALEFEYPLTNCFKYLPDPEIHSIHPQVTTVSGTKVLTITGLYLDSVESPRMIVNIASSVNGESLQIISDPCWFNHSSSFSMESTSSTVDGSTMMCPTPPLKSSAFHAPTERAPLVTHVAFLMDGVEKLKQLPMYEREMSQLLYYPDPEFKSFGTSSLEIPDDQTHLEIKGKYLNLAHEQSDVKILFDNTTVCKVDTISSEALTCIIPDLSTLKKNVSEYSVSVSVGSLTFPLGQIKLVEDYSAVPRLVTNIIVVICFLIAIGILCKYIKRRCEIRAKKQHNYRITFNWNEDTSNENSCAAARAEEGRRSNDYQDLPGRRLNRQISAAAAAASPAEACQSTQVVDDETMHLLQSENILVPRNYLSMGEVIGEGHFGCVYKGELMLPNKEDKLEVAVKTLHNSWSRFEQDTEAFLQEGLMMKDFHHHNVLTLIGICFESDGSPMVIIPFMKYGDLLSFIRSEDNSFSVKELMTFAVQIAAGMKYLAEIKFVHRDLAARNCMLDDDKTVKVADFGLSRDIYERDYYSSDNKKTKLPIKWMAPECIEKGSYTSKSDVWSYGVVLWELMTRGVAPYPGVDNWDILQYIKLGRRMPQPSYCPDLLYEIMLSCWNEDPKQRPSFAQLQEQVQNAITKLQRKNKQRTVGLDVTYVNFPPSRPSENQAELT